MGPNRGVWSAVTADLSAVDLSAVHKGKFCVGLMKESVRIGSR